MKTFQITSKKCPFNPRVGIRNISDYSPFGVLLAERTVESAYFRRGYQGSEKDDEVSGSGNSYTTFYRQLDPRLGKWMSIDPQTKKYAWSSPYISMNNSPIVNNDVFGDEFDEQSKQTVTDTKSKINDRIKEINDQLSTLKSKKQTELRIAKIEELSSQLGSLNDAINEINEMENTKDVTYSLQSITVSATKRSAETKYDPKRGPNGSVVIEWDSYTTLVHELKHAYQMLTEGSIFMGENAEYSLSRSVPLEVEAYQREFAFTGGPTGVLPASLSKMSDITSQTILDISITDRYGNITYPYSVYSKIRISSDMILNDFNSAWKETNGSDVFPMNEDQKEYYGNMKLGEYMKLYKESYPELIWIVGGL